MAEIGGIVERYCVGSGDGNIEPVLRAKDNSYGVDVQVVGGNLYSSKPNGTASGYKGKWDNIGRG